MTDAESPAAVGAAVASTYNKGNYTHTGRTAPSLSLTTDRRVALDDTVFGAAGPCTRSVKGPTGVWRMGHGRGPGARRRTIRYD